MFVTYLRGCHHRYQLVPIGLSLALAAFFKRAQLSGFVELDKVTRQLRAAQATPTMAIASGTAVWRRQESRADVNSEGMGELAAVSGPAVFARLCEPHSALGVQSRTCGNVRRARVCVYSK